MAVLPTNRATGSPDPADDYNAAATQVNANTVLVAGALQAANNLSELPSKTTALINLGVGQPGRALGPATLDSTGVLAVTQLPYNALNTQYATQAQLAALQAQLNALTVTATSTYPPNAPTITGVTAGQNSVSVAFNVSATDGTHSAAVSYVATASSGQTSSSGSSSPLTISGLVAGTPITATVTATNTAGTATSTSSASFTPTAPGGGDSTATTRTMLYNAPVAPLTGTMVPARYQISATAGDYTVQPSPTGSGSVKHLIATFGCAGDGTTDDGAKIQAALQGLTAGDVLVFDAGHTFYHTNRIVPTSTVGFTVYGYNSTLLAKNDRGNALCIQAANSTWIGLEHKVGSNPNGRSGDNLNDAMWAMTRVGGDSGTGIIQGIRLFGTKSTNSPASGYFFYHCQNYTTTDITGTNALADGLHNTSEATYFIHNRPNMITVGDDGFSVVSYTSDAYASSNGEFNRPYLSGNSHGRGMAVVGGHDIAWNDININNSDAAGILIGDENDADHTYPVSNISVARGIVKDANITRNPDQGSLIFTASYPNATQLVGPAVVDRIAIFQTNTYTTGFAAGGYATAKNGGNTSSTRPEFIGCVVTNSQFTGGHDTAPAYYSDQSVDGSQGVNFLGLTIGNSIPADSLAVLPNAPGSASYITQLFAPVAPAAPVLTATAGSSSVSLSWTAPNNNGSAITGYSIFQGTTTGGEGGTAVATPSSSATTYVVTGLTPSTAYYFTIKATNAGGTSVASNEATATPTTVAALTQDATSTALSSGASPSLPWSHTLASTANLIVIGISFNVPAQTGGSDYPPTTGVTVGGVAATKVDRAISTGSTTGTNRMVEIWYLQNPPTGVQTITVTCPAPSSPSGLSNPTLGVGAVSYKNALSTPLGTSAKTATTLSAGLTSLSVTTTASHGVVFGAYSGRNTTAGTIGSGETAIENSFTGNVLVMVTTQAVGAPATTQGTQAAADQSALLAVPILSAV